MEPQTEGYAQPMGGQPQMMDPSMMMAPQMMPGDPSMMMAAQQGDAMGYMMPGFAMPMDPSMMQQQGPPPDMTGLVIQELERQRANPWTVAELEQLEEEARDSMLGERLYPLIAILEPERAGKITGMLLELNDNELFELLMPQDMSAGAAAVRDNVAEARQVLLEFEQQEAAEGGGPSPPPSPPGGSEIGGFCVAPWPPGSPRLPL